ncbi:hypothetical protein KJ693_12345 [bacterium]|nr:hypothetical protein [bacterium]
MRRNNVILCVLIVLTLIGFLSSLAYAGFGLGLPGAIKERVKELDKKIKAEEKKVNHPPNIPSNPLPTDKAPDQPINIGLSWTGGDPDGDSVKHDIYLDTTSPPNTLASSGQTETTYDPPHILSINTTYYWRIVATDNHDSSTTGPVWSFTTGTNQAPTISSLSANPTTVSLGGNSTITCTASDPDGDSLTYTWTKTGGTISENGFQVTWTAPQTDRTYTITCTISDGKGGADQKSVTVTVASGGNGGDEAFPFVDGYSPPLTEAEGTVREGDFLPFDEGYHWWWDGSASVSGSMTMTFEGQSETMPIDESDIPIYATWNVQQAKEITLPSGRYTVFPNDERLGAYYGSDYFGSSEVVRYFEKTGEALYIRAIEIDNNIFEIENPVYLKNRLVVGDKWETCPQVDFNRMLKSMDFPGEVEVDADMKCVFFVVGKEEKNYAGQDVETVRVDQRAEVNGTMNISYSGPDGEMEMRMDFHITMAFILNLLENVGIIAQEEEDTNLSMNCFFDFDIEGESGSGSMKMNMEETSYLGLTDHSFGSPMASTPSFPKRQPPQKESAFNKTSTTSGDSVIVQKKIKPILKKLSSIVRNMSL